MEKRKLSLIESAARTLATTEPETAPLAKERAALVTDIEDTFKSMISNVQTVRRDLGRIFAENSVLAENTTPLTAQRVDTVLVGLLKDLKKLSIRHN